ncbi:MAG: HD domain-containing protein [Sedimentibacter sp.]|uniref:Ppx/GppA phosphatase family protein n=1 Tax=Sedimentibacter sp. TaxID=1960295 RepID=UPI0029811282|nr:HD domain-containing protein [Sedimentibacter sp.]MDW5299190.1 HD domain-containing protein [Sedimentibacter sp.]
MKNKNQLIAAIDIGSHSLRMKIVEMNLNFEVKILENIRRNISLGRDTYAMGKISFDTLNETCKILKGFKQLMTDYNITTYVAVATSAVREAANRDFILDQIKIKTGFHINVITNSEERYLIFKAIKNQMKNYRHLREENCIIVDIGSGSIQVSMYDNDKLILSKNIKLGFLRIRELLSDLQGRTLNFPKIMEEYIESNIDNLMLFHNIRTFKNLIVIGGEIKLINTLCISDNKADFNKYILKEDFLRVYNAFLFLSPQSIVKDYKITQESSDILLPTMMILKKFLDITTNDMIYTPMVTLVDGVVSDVIEKRNPNSTNELQCDILSLCRLIGEKFQYQKKHAEDVENKSLILFNSLKKLHGLNNREKFLLQIAAILHDVGKYISFNKHYINSYNVILASDILGLSDNETKIVANVARYHSSVVPSHTHENFISLDEQSRIVVSKLAAIIRIADALDRSHKQKIKDMTVTYNGNIVIINVASSDDVLLEQWTFEMKSEFFREVFGVSAILKVKKVASDV